jgi:hypothetical protein
LWVQDLLEHHQTVQSSIDAIKAATADEKEIHRVEVLDFANKV